MKGISIVAIIIMLIGISIIPLVSTEEINQTDTPKNDFPVLIGLHEKSTMLNEPPTKPDIIGLILINKGEEVTYFVESTDPDDPEYKLDYKVDFGDGNITEWSSMNFKWHTYQQTGDFKIRVKAKDEKGAQSSWSDPLNVTVEEGVKHVEYRGGIFVTAIFRNHYNYKITNFSWNMHLENMFDDDIGFSILGKFAQGKRFNVPMGGSVRMRCMALGIGLLTAKLECEYHHGEWTSYINKYIPAIILGPFVIIQGNLDGGL